MLVLAIVFGLYIPNNVIAKEVEETGEVISNDFKSYLNENGKLEITSSKPKDILDFLIRLIPFGYESNLDFEKISFDFNEDIPDNFNKTILIINFKTKKEEFNLYDLEIIDFYYNKHKMPLYYDIPMLNLVSSEVKSILQNNNIKLKMLIQDAEENNEEEQVQDKL